MGGKMRINLGLAVRQLSSPFGFFLPGVAGPCTASVGGPLIGIWGRLARLLPLLEVGRGGRGGP